MLGDGDLRAFAKDAPLHLDDRPSLEFTAPYYLYRGEDKEIFATLLKERRSFLPDGVSGLTVTRSGQAELYNLAGEAFMRSQDLQQADALFGEALNLDNRMARTWTNRGRVFIAMGHQIQAEQSLEKALELDPRYSLAWFHLGMLYASQGIEEKGLRCLEEGLKQSPDNPMGSLQAGLIYLRNGQKERAKSLFSNALKKPITNKDLKMSLLYSLNAAEHYQ
jgi:tetratricopeptide (TPR) repeat protein